MSDIKDKLAALSARYTELEEAHYRIQDLIMDMEAIDLPEGYSPSHHSEMEWCSVLNELEHEMAEIRGRLDG